MTPADLLAAAIHEAVGVISGEVTPPLAVKMADDILDTPSGQSLVARTEALESRLRYASMVTHSWDPEHTGAWEDCRYRDCAEDRAALAQPDAQEAK